MGICMKKVKINFCDQWDGFVPTESDEFHMLQKHYEVELSNSPDFVFCGSNLKWECMKYDCVRILITNENRIPDFNVYDFGASSSYLDFGERYFRKPVNFVSRKILNRSTDVTLVHRKFCNFIYNNQRFPGTKIRNDFCLALQAYKPVDCPGRVLHNIDCPDLEPRNGNWKNSKQQFLTKYKFTIAFENSSSPGYTTEKLVQPMYALSIPIYWGNPIVSKEFNTKAFINCADYDNDFSRVIERVKELDNDDEQYLEMISQCPVVDDFDFDLRDKYDAWLCHIIDRGNIPFDKGYMYDFYERFLNHARNE